MEIENDSMSITKEYKKLNERISRFHMIEHIPEFENNEKQLILVRFENMDDVNEYLDIMIGYAKIAVYEKIIDNIDTLSYNIIFTEPGWYIGFTNNSILDKNIEYIYEYNVQFNATLRDINSYLS